MAKSECGLRSGSSHPLSTLGQIRRQIRKDIDRFNAEKVKWAKGQGLHIFGLGTRRCLFCDKAFEEVKKETEPISVVFDGNKVLGYPNCAGHKEASV